MKRFDDELEDDRKTNSATTRKEYAKYAVMAILVLVLAVALVFLLRPKKEETLSIDPEEQTENREISVNTELPQTETGETEEPIQLLTAGTIPETREQTLGIDVAKYQGVIDWKKVATEGIEFAMIRVGYRSLELGEIHEDEMARYNLQEASKNGIKLGLYSFSSAVTKEEAVEEADWVAELISQYPITYPVAYDCEGFDNEKNRHFCLTKEERSEIAEAFMDRIYEQGYTPMLYAAKNELADDAKWETADLEKHYRVWVSHYNTIAETDYAGEYAMWQYTNQGTVDGISGNVDLNIAYFGYEGEEAPHSSILPEQVTANVEALMNFEEVNDTVTAKNKTKLRDKPSQGDDSTVMLQLVNGETAVRTGISKSGWSRVEYNGETYYAVSSYLTTDLSAPAQKDTPVDDDGIKTEFTACNDVVTAKIEVNLRTLPSVTMEESQIVATLHNGETVIRTGINMEYGWSRVEYNGQTLYCVSSYLQTAE